MGAYPLLLSLEVAHAYFPGGVCRGLSLEPSAATRQLLERAGCLLRPTDRGLLLAHDAERADALALLASDAAQPLTFDFLGRGPDANFANCTEGDIGSQQALLAFDGYDASADASSGHRQLRATRMPLDSAEAARVLSVRERRVPPHFVVTLRLSADDLAHKPWRYRCSLGARATVWKYCLFGELAEQPEALQVVDLGQELRFGPAVGERLPDGRAMQALRSSQPIALQERSAQRFQLRRQGAGADKVLVKRLPVASPSQLHRETLGGVPTWVSEIYVHR